MAVWQIESGTCTGRGFSGVDADGFLAKFAAWIVRAPTADPLAAGGPGWYILDDQSAAVTDPYIVVCNLAAPGVNDLCKILKVGMTTALAGFVDVQGYLSWDVATHTGQGLWFGQRPATLDSAEFAYDFRGGEYGIVITSRIGTSWKTTGMAEWEGDSNFIEDETVVGTLQAGVTAGSSVVLSLDTGEAALFSQDKYYYIYDMDGHTWCNYVKCTNVDTGADEITIDACTQNFPAGAVIAAYRHRFASFGNAAPPAGATYYDYQYAGKIPYYSSLDQSYVMYNSVLYTQIVGGIYADFMVSSINVMIPDDNGNFSVQRPTIVEIRRPNAPFSAIGMNRAYGPFKNIYVTVLGTMSPGLDGRVISSKNFIYIQKHDIFTGSTDYAILFQDTIEAT